METYKEDRFLAFLGQPQGVWTARPSRLALVLHYKARKGRELGGEWKWGPCRPVSAVAAHTGPTEGPFGPITLLPTTRHYSVCHASPGLPISNQENDTIRGRAI